MSIVLRRMLGVRNKLATPIDGLDAFSCLVIESTVSFLCRHATLGLSCAKEYSTVITCNFGSRSAVNSLPFTSAQFFMIKFTSSILPFDMSQRGDSGKNLIETQYFSKLYMLQYSVMFIRYV